MPCHWSCCEPFKTCRLSCYSLVLLMIFALHAPRRARSFQLVTSKLSTSESTVNMKSIQNISQHKFSVAPMMEYTDAHQRYLWRLISSESVLYTEMIAATTLIHTAEPERFLRADFDFEDPVVVQLGGSNPVQMGKAAKIATDFGYKEININCGCPSERVAGSGCFGAALMRDAGLVSELAIAVGEASGRPATIKCRIGVDDADSYEELAEFVSEVAKRGQVDHFIVHARKAVLNANFSPADNRNIPPLRYDFVHKLVKDFPSLAFTINGGFTTYEDSLHQLSQGVHGVMVGRSVIDKPFYWNQVDSKFYGQKDPDLCRGDILERYADYAQRMESRHGGRVRRSLAKPLLGLFTGEYNGRAFRASLDTYLKEDISIREVICRAGLVLQRKTLDLTASQMRDTIGKDGAVASIV